MYIEKIDNGRQIVHLWDSEKNYMKFPYKKYAFKKNPAGTYFSLYGDRLSKIHRWTWGEEDLFESDVKPSVRTLIDLYADDDEPSPDIKTMIFDIEVEVIDGFPLPKYAKNRITSIAFNDEDEYYCLILDPEHKVTLENENVIRHEDEASLLNDFLKRYMAINPDILTGWYTDSFDIPYIYNRMTKILSKDLASCLSPMVSNL